MGLQKILQGWVLVREDVVLQQNTLEGNFALEPKGFLPKIEFQLLGLEFKPFLVVAAFEHAEIHVFHGKIEQEGQLVAFLRLLLFDRASGFPDVVEGEVIVLVSVG